MTTYTKLGEDYYKDFLEKDKKMTYVDDICEKYRNEYDYSGDNDTETYIVKFLVELDKVQVLVTATKCKNNTQLLYKGYSLKPNVRYLETYKIWCIIDKTILNNAIRNRDAALVTDLLEYYDHYSKFFLSQKILELMNPDLNHKKSKYN